MVKKPLPTLLKSEPMSTSSLPRAVSAHADASSDARPGFVPMGLAAAAAEYATDFWQRALLYADVRRERGNQYLDYLSDAAPTVLDFEYETVMSGAELPRPVNYWLARIVAPAGVSTDDRLRPFVVVDPRAGHGPGIGGFKPDSEIGAALKAGHPCYFVGFLPTPVKGQTVEDVMRAEAAFVRCVGERHPEAGGLPVVVANCQAGWQIMMTAAVWPELFGPIVLAGAPLSYWAGSMPMRYTGGLLGGSWLTEMVSDLNGGRFDGAWLVSNFESLNPANTLWTKQYHVFSEVDTEAPRYLEFEKYWGGLAYLEGGEIQYIVDNLFIGNRLSSGQLVTSDGTRIDLRNIRSPIVVFCSHGDNITPPPQALGWITDLYQEDREVLAHGQTIIYATHESIGHLGIFVSGSVGRKEHSEFAANIDAIDLTAPGIYRAIVEERPADLPNDELAGDPFLTTLRRSSLAELREIVQPDADNERRFATAAWVSDFNRDLYRRFWQPWVKAAATSGMTRWLGEMQPLRLGFSSWSDRHPLAAMVRDAAAKVRQDRRPASPDNPFVKAQSAWSEAMIKALDGYRDQRDAGRARAFAAVFGLPWLQALAGHRAADGPARPMPGNPPAIRAALEDAELELDEHYVAGGIAEAMVRAVHLVVQVEGSADERLFNEILDWLRRLPGLGDAGMPALRELTQAQGLLVEVDPETASATLPDLLDEATPAELAHAAEALQTLFAPQIADGSLADEARERLRQLLALFEPGADAHPSADPSTHRGTDSEAPTRPTRAAGRGSAAKAAGRTGTKGGSSPRRQAQATAQAEESR